MDVLNPFFGREHLMHINKIRTHLKLLRLSDMCDITGKYILPNIKDGINHRNSTYGWMTQPLIKIPANMETGMCQTPAGTTHSQTGPLAKQIPKLDVEE